MFRMATFKNSELDYIPKTFENIIDIFLRRSPSENQGQMVEARESLNGRRLDYPPPLTAHGSPSMLEGKN